MTLVTKTSIKYDATNSLTTLYVEGKEKSLDPTVLKALFVDSSGRNIVVRAVGSSNSVKGVVAAFHTLKRKLVFSRGS